MDDKRAAKETPKNTTIGPTIKIRGKLRAAEDLIVRGRVDADITSTKELFLENSGIVKANVKVRAAHIRGILVGDVQAEAKTEIAADGRVVGDIMSPKVVISDGAAFRGKIDMPNFDEPRKQLASDAHREVASDKASVRTQVSTSSRPAPYSYAKREVATSQSVGEYTDPTVELPSPFVTGAASSPPAAVMAAAEPHQSERLPTDPEDYLPENSDFDQELERWNTESGFESDADSTDSGLSGDAKKNRKKRRFF